MLEFLILAALRAALATSAHARAALVDAGTRRPRDRDRAARRGAERGGGIGFTSPRTATTPSNARVNQGLVRRGEGGVLKNSLERRRRPAPRVQPRLEGALLELRVVGRVLGLAPRRLVARPERAQVVLD